MPEIQTKLAPPGEEVIKLNTPYHIDKVSEITGENKGYRLHFSNKEYSEIAIPLWTGKSGMVNQQSKLGTFIRTFGTNTDTWVGKSFQVINWSLKNRIIAEVK